MDRRTVLGSLAGLVGAGTTFAIAQNRKIVREAADLSGSKSPPPRRAASGQGLKSLTLTEIPIGGGGFVTGIDISADGSRYVCRTDVANAYVRNKGDQFWQPLFSPATLQPSDYDPPLERNGKADGQGVAGIRIAPSNKDVIYASYVGFIWISTDGGRSLRRTSMPQAAMPSNAGVQRLFNRIIDVDPADHRRVIVGTWGEGAWYTLDGDAWAKARLPASGKSKDGSPGIHLTLFDAKRKDRVFVFVTGVGLCQSTTGPGGEFFLIRGGPTLCSSMVAGPDGKLYLCEQGSSGDGKVWTFDPERSTWRSSRPEHEAMLIAVDPRRPGRLIASNPNSYIMTSEDDGATWKSIGGALWSKRGGELAWTRDLVGMYPAEMLFDPTIPDQLWFAQGVGVVSARASTSPYQLTDWSAGIEELCAVYTLTVPGGKTFLSAWDKSFWRVDDYTSYSNGFRYPLAKGMNHNPGLVAYGSYMDYAGDDPTFMVGVVAPSSEAAPGFTANGGDSWQAFSGAPAAGWGNGGCIAASTKRNIVLLPSNNGTGAYTLDGGASWSPIMLDGKSPTSGFANAFYVTRKNVTADKTRPGTFALIYTIILGDGYGNPLGGVWLTRDGGASWTQMLKGVVDPVNSDPKAVRGKGLEERQFWQCQLDYIPGRSGELVYTPHADFADDRFYWSRDDGRSWAELHPDIRNVSSFGFGKPAAGQTRPVLFFWGRIKKITGLWMTADWFATAPTLVTRFPSRMLANVSTVAGDPNHFGRVVLGTSCAGWVRVDVEI